MRLTTSFTMYSEDKFFDISFRYYLNCFSYFFVVRIGDEVDGNFWGDSNKFIYNEFWWNLVVVSWRYLFYCLMLSAVVKVIFISPQSNSIWSWNLSKLFLVSSRNFPNMFFYLHYIVWGSPGLRQGGNMNQW